MEGSQRNNQPDTTELDDAVKNLGNAIRKTITEMQENGWTEEQAGNFIQMYLMQSMQTQFMGA